MVEIGLFLNRSLSGPLDLREVPKPSVPPVAEAASVSGSETVLVLVALIVIGSAINEQYKFLFKRPTFRTADCVLRQGQKKNKKNQHQPGIGGGRSGSLLQWYRQGEVLREGQGRENRKYGEKGDRRAGGRAR